MNRRCIQGRSWGQLTEVQSEHCLPIALHYSFPREQSVEPIPRCSNTINYHRMQKPQYTSTQVRYFPQRNHICIKYCYASYARTSAERFFPRRWLRRDWICLPILRRRVGVHLPDLRSLTHVDPVEERLWRGLPQAVGSDRVVSAVQKD